MHQTQLRQSKRTRLIFQGSALLGLAGLVGLSIAATPGPPTLKADAATSSSKQVTAPDETKVMLDSNTYAQATSVRRNAALGDKELAALGLTQEQAEAVLQRLVDWCETNGTQIDQAHIDLRAAEQAVVELERKVRVGATPQELQQLPGKRRDRHAAHAALQNLQEQGAMHAMGSYEISSSVMTAWQQARGHDQSILLELRYLPTLNEARLKALRSLASQNGVALQDALGFNEIRQLQEIRLRVQDGLPGVAAAVEKVLPDPESEGLLDDLIGTEIDFGSR